MWFFSAYVTASGTDTTTTHPSCLRIDSRQRLPIGSFITRPPPPPLTREAFSRPVPPDNFPRWNFHANTQNNFGRTGIPDNFSLASDNFPGGMDYTSLGSNKKHQLLATQIGPVVFLLKPKPKKITGRFIKSIKRLAGPGRPHGGGARGPHPAAQTPRDPGTGSACCDRPLLETPPTQIKGKVPIHIKPPLRWLTYRMVGLWLS